ncbi:hypothetical protein J4442_05565 [Candidatus Woesearchaeota archaeon]|nr:hypothetical protein [Candidatus Woesearchaeota archaeon]
MLKEDKSDAQAIQEVISALIISSILWDNSDANSVTNNLNLITNGEDDTTIKWSSSNKNVVENDGSVSRPQFDTPIILTATVSKGAISAIKTFSVVVLGTTDPDEFAVSQAKLSLTEKLVLNGNTEKNNILSDLKLFTNLTGHSGVSITWNSSNTTYVATNGSVTRDINEDKEITLTATLSKSGKSATKVFGLTVKKQVAPATMDNNGKVEVNDGENEILIDTSNANNLKEIEVPTTVDDDEEVVLNLGALIDNDKKITLGGNELTLTRATSTVTYSVEIPANTQIQGESDWNGLITLPTVKAVADVVSLVTTGIPEVSIEIGSANAKLTFDKAVKLTIPNQAGKSAGYALNNVFTTIPACTDAQIADPDANLVAEGDCYVTSGSDLVIWTKHFTQFISYTPTSATSGGTSSGAVRNLGLSGGGATTGGTEEIDEEVKESAGEIEVREEIAVSKVEEAGNEITGAVIGAGSRVGTYIGVIAIVFVIIVGVLQGGTYLRRKYRGMYF